jgi:predicted transglutaminase-like cysteine proteinase
MKLSAILAILVLMHVPAKADEPFGVDAVPSQSAYLSAVWRNLQAAIARDESVIARCRGDPACSSDVALRLIGVVKEARQYQGRKMIGHLNRAINLAIARTRADVPWLSPLAALAQPGDCKSYAMVKYLALGEAGIKMTDRRLVMVRFKTSPSEKHLVTVVRDGERWLILDSMTNALVDSTAAHPYEPLEEFDANGVWDFGPTSHRVAEFRPSIGKDDVSIQGSSLQRSYSMRH